MISSLIEIIFKTPVVIRDSMEFIIFDGWFVGDFFLIEPKYSFEGIFLAMLL